MAGLLPLIIDRVQDPSASALRAAGAVRFNQVHTEMITGRTSQFLVSKTVSLLPLLSNVCSTLNATGNGVATLSQATAARLASAVRL